MTRVVPASLLAVLLAGGATFAGADETKLVPDDVTLSDALGNAVAVSGDTVLLGAPWDGDRGAKSGSAYVFQRDPQGEWAQVSKLAASDGGTSDLFGWSAAIGGDTAVVGAPGDSALGQRSGSAYVFQRGPGGGWTQVRKLNAADAAAGDSFGWSVAIDGDTIIVGAYGDDAGGADAGAAYLFERNRGGSNLWGQARKLISSDAESNEQCGWSVAIDGDRAVVGAPGDNGSGRAYLFLRAADGTWFESKKLAVPGQQAFDDFGWSVAVGTDVVLVGARRAGQGGVRSGWVQLFERNEGGNNNWGRSKRLVASDAAGGDLFGSSVAIAGDMVLVGAPANGDAGTRSGAAYLFQRDAGGAASWSEVRKLVASDARAEDAFGGSVAIARGAAVVGAPGPPAVGSGAGGAYLFAASNGTVCSVVPATDCLAGWRTGMLLVDQEGQSREKIVVKLGGGPALAQADFGNPLLAGGTAYRLCFYEDSGASIGAVAVDAAGASCGGKPCWRPLGASPPDGFGFQYQGARRKLRLRGGDPGEAQLLYKATVDIPTGLAVRLHGNDRPMVQIVPDEGPACFSLTTSRVRVDRLRFFKAKN